MRRGVCSNAVQHGQGRLDALHCGTCLAMWQAAPFFAHMQRLPPCNHLCVPPCVHVRSQMLTKDPKKRPAAKDLLNHPWFQEVRCEL